MTFLGTSEMKALNLLVDEEYHWATNSNRESEKTSIKQY